MPRTLLARSCALGTSLALLALSFPALATGGESGDMVPGASSPTYNLPPGSGTTIEEIDLQVQTNTLMDQWLEDFMFDFDDGCWEQFGETSGPMSIEPATYWGEAHTRWMKDFVLSEDLPQVSSARAFDPPPSQEAVAFVSSPSLLEDMPELAEELQAAPPSMVWEPLALSSYPVTGMMIDTRHWYEVAATEFEDCLWADYQGASIAFAQATGALVSAIPAGLPPNDVIHSCYQQMEQLWGDPCLPADAELCVNFDWHESWCGRRSFDSEGADPGWACHQAVTDAVATYVGQTGATVEPILLPETTYVEGVAIPHEGLVRADGIRIELNTDAAYHETGSYSPTATATATDELYDQMRRDSWAAGNALEVHSCEEYAYERYLDMSEWEQAGIEHQRDVRWMFDAAFYGIDSMGPYVTPPPIKPNFRGSDGDEIWLNDGLSPDDGFVPWTRANYSAPEENKRRHRLFATYQPGSTPQLKLTTFKNVYYYLHRLRKGPVGDFAGNCDGWKEDLREHFVVNTGWHRLMDQTAEQAGFLDDEMERMRDKQDELWEVYLSYLASDDVVERQQLTARIDEALREGYEAGCIPLDPSFPTVCDWAPSLFVQGVLEELEHWRTYDYEECVDELGEAHFDDADIKAKFVDLSQAGVTLPEPWATFIDDAQNVVQGRSYTASPGQLRLYYHDMLGFYSLWGYRELIAQAIGALGDRALTNSTDYEQTMGGEFFGVSLLHQSQFSVGSDPFKACTSVPETGALDAVEVRLGPWDKKLYEGATNLVDNGYVVDPNAYTPNPDGSFSSIDNWGFGQSMWLGGELTPISSQGDSIKAGLGWSAGWSLGYSYAMPLATAGWATLKLRLGASAGINVSGGISASRTWPNPQSEATEEELLMNGGTKICKDITSTSVGFNLTPSANASGSAALGVSLANVLEVGIKGTLTIIDVALPISYTATVTNDNPAREYTWDHDFRVDLVLTMLSGRISAYVALDAIVTTITIFELVLAKWHGRRVDLALKNDTLQGGNVCMTRELALIGGLVQTGSETDPCPCRLRPADCHG